MPEMIDWLAGDLREQIFQPATPRERQVSAYLEREQIINKWREQGFTPEPVGDIVNHAVDTIISKFVGGPKELRMSPELYRKLLLAVRPPETERYGEAVERRLHAGADAHYKGIPIRVDPQLPADIVVPFPRAIQAAVDPAWADSPTFHFTDMNGVKHVYPRA